jgi:thiol-disulfide isomerase/thioredoxin
MITRRHLTAALAATPLATTLGACRGDPSFKLFGKAMPDRDWPMADGTTLNLAKLGKPAMVRFWGLWCPVCERDETYWQDVVRAMRSRDGLLVMSAHSGPAPSSGPTVSAWAAAQKADVKVPVLDDSDRTLSDLIDLPGVPLTILINSEGKIFETAWAFASERGVRNYISSANYVIDRKG